MPRPEIVFDPGEHSYRVNGVLVPSVTTVIKATVPVPFSAGAWYGYKMGVEASHEVICKSKNPALFGTQGVDPLMVEAKKIINPNSNLRNAADRGNFVHNWIEFVAETDVEPPWDVPEDCQKRIDGLRKWLDANQPTFMEAEVRTASVEHGYAGTLDAFAAFGAGPYEGQRGRIDWKTSKRVYPDQHFVQLEAYEQSEVECGEPPSDFRAIIHIPESGRVVTKPNTTYEFLDFELLLALWKRQQIHA